MNGVRYGFLDEDLCIRPRCPRDTTVIAMSCALESLFLFGTQGADQGALGVRMLSIVYIETDAIRTEAVVVAHLFEGYLSVHCWELYSTFHDPSCCVNRCPAGFPTLFSRGVNT